MRIVAFTFLSNHCHFLLYPESVHQMARFMAYVLANVAREIGRAHDWPGPQCVVALTEGNDLSGTWYDRTAEFRARRMGLAVSELDFASTETVTLSPLGCLSAASERERCELVGAIVADIERSGRIERAGRVPLGRTLVQRQHPHQRPSRSKRTCAPDFHAASRAARMRLRAAYRVFVAAYRRAAQLLRAGMRDVLFPVGSFPPSLPYVPVVVLSG